MNTFYSSDWLDGRGGHVYDIRDFMGISRTKTSISYLIKEPSDYHFVRREPDQYQDEMIVMYDNEVVRIKDALMSEVSDFVESRGDDIWLGVEEFPPNFFRVLEKDTWKIIYVMRKKPITRIWFRHDDDAMIFRLNFSHRV